MGRRVSSNHREAKFDFKLKNVLHLIKTQVDTKPPNERERQCKRLEALDGERV